MVISSSYLSTSASARHLVRTYLRHWPVAAVFFILGSALGSARALSRPAAVAAFELGLPDIEAPPRIESAGCVLTASFERRLGKLPLVERALLKTTGRSPTPHEVSTFAEHLHFEWPGSNRPANRIRAVLTVGEPAFATRYLENHLEVFLEREMAIAVRSGEANVRYYRQELQAVGQVLEAAPAGSVARASAQEQHAALVDRLDEVERQVKRQRAEQAGLYHVIRAPHSVPAPVRAYARETVLTGMVGLLFAMLYLTAVLRRRSGRAPS